MPQPRRMPSRRSDTLVMTIGQHDADGDADDDAERRLAMTTAVIPHPRRTAARRRRTATRPERRSTSATSSARGWNAERGVERDGRRRVDVAVEREAVRDAGAVGQVRARRLAGRGGSCSASLEAAHARLVARHLGRRRRRRTSPGGRSVTSTAWPPAWSESSQNRALAAADAHAADASSRPGARRRTARRWRVGTAWAMRIITSSGAARRLVVDRQLGRGEHAVDVASRR